MSFIGLGKPGSFKIVSFKPGKVVDENIFHWKNCLVAGKLMEINLSKVTGSTLCLVIFLLKHLIHFINNLTNISSNLTWIIRK